METRTIGSLEVSVVGLGCNNFGMRIDEDRAHAVVAAALDAGVTMFDTADIYGGTRSEEFLGRALEDSLGRLGTDRIDLYQLHFPDDKVPLDETLGALDELVRAGKVREIGCSNFSPELIEQADGVSRARATARFASVQNEYSLLRRGPEKGVLDACEKYDLAFIPYFPLASGVLTGKYRRGEPPPPETRLANAPAERVERALSERNFDKVEALQRWVADHGHSLLELAMSWLLCRPRVTTVIAGATRPEQVTANVAAAGWKLTAAELDEIDQVLAV